MKPHRISVKYFVKEVNSVDVEQFIPIFHSWIQQQKVSDHLLLDVADYKHVPQGPGVILIAHEADLSLDLVEDRPGLLYIRKRGWSGDLRDRLRTVFREGLKGARLIESEPALVGSLTFHTQEAQLSFLDRLQAPNTAETFAAVRGEIDAVLAEIHPDATVTVERASEDRRHPFSVRIHVEGAASLVDQLARLEHVHA